MIISALRKIHQKQANIKVRNKIVKQLKKNKKQKFVLLGTPLHGNLGDQAIVLKEYEFLKDNFANAEIIEIPRYYYDLLAATLKTYISSTDLILIHGGGYLGTIWLSEELFVRKVIELFQNNKIIIFPQTVSYEKSDFGKQEPLKAQQIYSKHKNLTIFARECNSYNFLKENFNCNIYLTPDIVLYGSNSIIKNSSRRETVVFCFRKDKEKKLTDEQINSIKNCQRLQEFEPLFVDTVVNYNVFSKTRKKEVEKKLEIFSQAKIVVTDRLHGMIFAAVTGTPCVAMSNSNGKVKAVYEWIKDFEYIKYSESPDDFEDVLNSLDINRSYRYNPDLLKDKFKPLTDILRSCADTNE